MVRASSSARKKLALPARLGHARRVNLQGRPGFQTVVPRRMIGARWPRGHRGLGGASGGKTSYLMRLEWKDGRISFIRDYRYVRYVVDNAELVLAPDASPRDRPIRQG